jgi:hypothetical protein
MPLVLELKQKEINNIFSMKMRNVLVHYFKNKGKLVVRVYNNNLFQGEH